MSKSYSTVSHTKIMKYLCDNHDKLITVNDIEKFLKNEGIEVNVSTIYRFLNKLSDGGEVMKYVAKKGEMSSFQYVGDTTHNCREHIHLQCVKCQRIIHLECDFMNELTQHIMNHHGFKLQCESSVLYGICKECQNEKN